METVNNDTATLSKDTDSDDNDLQLKLKKLADRVALHETEKQKMREEFGQQRAKMKELFLQKEEELKKGSTEHGRLLEEVKRLETELNEARTQVTVVSLELEGRLEEERRRYQDEVASLQQLVTETVEESSRNDDEVQRLRRLNEKLEAELEELRQNNSAGSGSGEGSGAQLLTVPGAVLSTLARRVASQLGADSSTNSLSQTHSNVVSENLEESMRKAQEDAEVLRSLVIPLEEEIKALKDKLRHTDDLLRKYQQNDEHYHPSESNFLPSAALTDDNTAVGNLTEKEANLVNIAEQSPLIPSAVALSPASSSSSQKLTNDTLVSQQLPQLSTSPSLLLCEINGEDTLAINSNVNLNSSNALPVTTQQIVQVDEDQHHKSKSCDMCINYEAQLVSMQEKCKDLEKQLVVLERCKEELAKEALIRKDMEQKWNEKKELHKIEVLELQTRAKDADNALKEVKELFKNTKTQVTDELNRLTTERRNIQSQLDRLQLENENLVGKRNANARELQDEVINLPDNVEELQEMLLKCREDLISARVGQEAAEQEVANLKEEAELQMFQTQVDNKSSQQLNNSLTVEIESLKSQLRKSELARHQTQLMIQRVSNEEKDLRLEIEDINMQLLTTNNAKKQLEEQVSELRSSLSSLQTELHNSEIVQKDFVRLSQSLQQELERIRSSHTQVRWEHEEDVEQCPGCRQSFAVTRRKQHCRHCGRVFCTPCLTHTVLSGPNQRPSKVCDVCHTLLVQDTAPYFSTEPPHSNN
ncbi:rab GTPase-binding effector protein rabaptin-5 isoform X2 [Lycorma delicatula]|uniref:rab GTPase-binding effector protein rabaptin-5 isoform X2 n=1 Tax=Lycorma delicatula TaxID=130591 RepID=UPI003F513E4E